LYGFAKKAGFSRAAVQVFSAPDTEGRSLNDIKSLIDHARRSGKMSEPDLEAVLDTVTRAMDEGKFFGLIPRIAVTATV
jgi:hypothetical protein